MMCFWWEVGGLWLVVVEYGMIRRALPSFPIKVAVKHATSSTWLPRERMTGIFPPSIPYPAEVSVCRGRERVLRRKYLPVGVVSEEKGGEVEEYRPKGMSETHTHAHMHTRTHTLAGMR